MGIRSYRDLDVYQKAFELSVQVHEASLEFPKIEQYALADQMRRASKSICANLAEGFTRQFGSNAEYKRFIMMALGSANEMSVWLDYAERFNYIPTEETKVMQKEYDGVCRMLMNLYKSRNKQL